MDRCIIDTDILSEYLKGHNSVVVGHASGQRNFVGKAVGRRIGRPRHISAPSVCFVRWPLHGGI